MNRIKIIFALLFLCGQAFAGTISVRAKTEVFQPSVTLGDLADFEGFSQDQIAMLEAINLGYAPNVGQRRLLPRAFIRARVARHLPEGSSLKINRHTEVLRQAISLEGDQVEKLISEHVEKVVSAYRSDIAELKIPSQGRILLGAGAKLEINSEAEDRTTDHIDVVLIAVDGQRETVVRKVVVSVDFFAEVLSVNRDHQRGESIFPADLVVHRIARSKMPRGVLTRPEEVEGSVLKRSVRMGEPLLAGWIDVPPVVVRGQRIRLIARRGKVRLSTLGESLDKGRIGQLIRVRNLSSKKTLSGRVTKEGNVELEF